MTWGVVLYPAWDEWRETDLDVRASVQAWLETWLEEGPPADAEPVDRLITIVGSELRYFTATHAPTGVIVTFITGSRGDTSYVALLSLQSPRD